MSTKPSNPTTEEAIRQLEVTALNIAYQANNIASVRSAYTRRAQEISSSLRAAYRNGEMSAKAAAQAAQEMRNMLLDLQRQRSTALGRALAERIKAKGIPLDALLDGKAQRLFGRPFAELQGAERTTAYLEVVESAGRANPKYVTQAARVGAAGRALFLLSVGLAAYNIANAEDRAWQAGREGAGMGGGLGGSIAAGAVAGVWFGPVGIAIGAFVGGVAGALMADQAYIAAVGASDRSAGMFLKRFTSFFATDEQGIADALYREKGIDMDAVHSVFRAMNESFTTDADDVAVLYLRRVFAGGGNVLQALRLNRQCRDELIHILDEGWTTREETALIGQLRALR